MVQNVGNNERGESANCGGGRAAPHTFAVAGPDTMASRDSWHTDSGSTADLLRVVSRVSRQQSQQSRHRQSLEPPPDHTETVDYSTAVDTLGTGKFHWYLALTCGFMYLAAGLQNNLNAYILPSVHCDLLISSAQMGLLNAVFLAGGIASNFLWGIIADVLGRKTVVVYGMFIDGVLTLCSSLSQHFYVLLAFRFLNGFVVGGPSSVIFAYMGEFFPQAVRATVICYVGVFWTFSWVIMPGVAWLVIPLSWSLEWNGLVFNSWRLLVALTCLPSFTAAALHLCFPESPLFLLVHGQGAKAVDTLATIYGINNGCEASEYPVKSLKAIVVDQENGSKNPSSAFRPFSVMIRQAQLLFTPSTIKITLLAAFLFFSNMYGYYGLGLWFPELFHRMAVHSELWPGVPGTVCSAPAPPSDTPAPAPAPCDGTTIDPSVFLKSVIIGLIGLLGNVIAGLMAGRLHRRTLPVVLMTISGLCVVVIYFTTNLTANLVIASLFQLAVGAANIVYNSLVVDMFPPNVSGIGVCFSVLAGRLGGMLSNLAFGHLLDISCTIPVFLCALVLFAGSIASFMIPKYPYTEEKDIPPMTFKADKKELSHVVAI